MSKKEKKIKSLKKKLKELKAEMRKLKLASIGRRRSKKAKALVQKPKPRTTVPTAVEKPAEDLRETKNVTVRVVGQH
jgi:hypothetical protein